MMEDAGLQVERVDLFTFGVVSLYVAAVLEVRSPIAGRSFRMTRMWARAPGRSSRFLRSRAKFCPRS